MHPFLPELSMIRIRNKLTSTCDKPTRDFNSKTSGNKKRAEAPVVEGEVAG